MTKHIIFLSLLLISTITVSQAQLSESKQEAITSYIHKKMQEIEIPGVAVAILKDNKVIYKNYLGLGNLEYNIPVNESSLFRLHSLSKVFVSVGVFQLIDQHKISLEDKIAKHLDDLPNDWKNIKIKHLLSHSSGLPDMREETNPSEEIAKQNVYAKEIQFPFGERASYNQTNFWLLNRIIRKITKGDFQSHIANQFEEKPDFRFSNIEDIVANRVMEYKPNNVGQLKNYHFLVQDYMFGAGGITMTLGDLINWDKKLAENTLISEAAKKEMFTPFKYKIGKGFSYGWDIQSLNNNISFGFNGGGLVNYRKFIDKNITVIWFTNGYRKPHNVDNITNALVGFIDDDLLDKTPEAGKKLLDSFNLKKAENAVKEYQSIKKKYPYVNFENVLNSIGYHFMNKKELEKAITVFKLNTEESPKSANAFDSLAEGYYNNKQYLLSKKYYQKSLSLNPSNTNAKVMLTKIDEL